ncbi:LOW QUALITY PROTEIN: interleukin-15 receptor subunit alpha [Ursus maritimus]|uniref:Interleukin-15 receptor subunit alpha n=2 Tax=Ursus TaxID=9639 RepID=A0A8M1H063_URSMA|nr:LOW QUALITY PROTEIN: interleukin-15 receptor subunit alpha [Ursus maritimus]
MRLAGRPVPELRPPPPPGLSGICPRGCGASGPLRAQGPAAGSAAERRAMARVRLSGCRVSALPALLLLLLLLLLLRPATPGITCPPPTSVEHADIRVKSYKVSSRERYTCNSGFKRKAGTSSLTECVLNETTNVAHWTIPNLKCIRDPSLTHLRPSSTEVPAGVTPEPESTSLSGKEPAFTSKSDTTVATKPAVVPGSRLMPSKPPATGTTGPIGKEPSRAPPQATAKASEHTPSASQETPGTYSYNSGTVTAAIFTPVAVLSVMCVVLLLVCYQKSRQTLQTPSVEMEHMEVMPMTRGTDSREDDAENHPHDLGHSRGRLRAAEGGAKAPTLP